MDEQWKSVPGFGGHYEASSLGRIRVKDRVVVKRHHSGKLIHQKYSGRLLSPCKRDKLGYMVVHLGVDGKKMNISVHRMVLLAFVGEPDSGKEACHNNGDASDNRAENLRWDTHKANNGDRTLHGTYALGEDHAMSKLTSDEVRSMRDSGLGCAELARKTGISKSHASRILLKKSWTHV